MSRSIRKKEKYVNKGEISKDHFDDGTAARTRVFSFDEIMLRRKNKKQSGNVEGSLGGEGSITGRGVENASGVVESDRYIDGGVGASSKQHASDELLKASLRKKEDNTHVKEGNLKKVEEKESRESERKSKAVLNSKDTGDKAKGGKKKRGIHDKRKNDDRSGDHSEKESGKRHSKDSVPKDRYTDRNRGKSENVSKRRNQNEDDVRTRDRDAGKKHELRKRHDSELSERMEKKDASQFRHEDSRSKRRRSRSREHDKDKNRRSRSREHDKDKNRRSISPSPRGHKHRSSDVQEREEFPSHSSKDRSGRFDSSTDRKRISSNGSSNKSRRHGVSASRLGGYSPRKRKSEAAVKTPSPTSRSPEKKNAGWDFPPLRMESKFPGSVLSTLQPLNQTELSNSLELSTVAPVTSSTPKACVRVLSSIPLKINASVDSIQLTQATRPKRRLYVENLPSSASEETVMECLNNYLLSSGVNHIQGTQPCISCIVNKEKGQALVEFLTHEYASAALSFDGRSFSGNILKIRRPKDYVEVTTGVFEKPVAPAVSVRNVVEDSPHKIFVCGISKVISSEMLMEIASGFGPLKAYRFETNADLSKPCAFLEYLDQSVTLKACVGLNGMKLGGQMITVIQAFPDTSSVENLGDVPFYGIPMHARALLERPTEVLKLKNVLDPNTLSSLSEPELEEILEDIRLECARFGVVKSVNVIKHTTWPVSPEACEVTNNIGSAVEEESDDENREGEAMILDSENVGKSDPSGSAKELEEFEEPAEGNSSHDDKQDRSDLTCITREPEERNKTVEANGTCHDELKGTLVKDEICDSAAVDNSTAISREFSDELNSDIDQVNCNDNNIIEIIRTGDLETENVSLVKGNLKSEEESEKLEMVSPQLDNGSRIELDDCKKGENKEQVSDLKDIFEPGCVLVEYRRIETCSTAAHCLHGRLFDGRIVTVGYIALDLYRARFPK